MKATLLAERHGRGFRVINHHALDRVVTWSHPSSPKPAALLTVSSAMENAAKDIIRALRDKQLEVNGCHNPHAIELKNREDLPRALSALGIDDAEMRALASNLHQAPAHRH